VSISARILANHKTELLQLKYLPQWLLQQQQHHYHNHIIIVIINNFFVHCRIKNSQQIRKKKKEK
jgi:hypothetical protein